MPESHTTIAMKWPPNLQPVLGTGVGVDWIKVSWGDAAPRSRALLKMWSSDCYWSPLLGGSCV